MKLTTRTLTTEEFPLWERLLENSEQTTVFCRRWWMDWATNESWQILGCFDKDRLIGAMPIWQVHVLGNQTLKIPPLTQVWGPVLVRRNAKYVKVQSDYTNILRALASTSSSWKDVSITMHHSIDNCLPFKWCGFKETIRYTYTLDCLTNTDEIWKETRENIRTDLRKAERNGIQVRDDLPIKELVRIQKRTFQHQGLSSKSRTNITSRASSSAIDASRGKIFAAVDKQGNVHAAALLVWDDRCAYYLLGGSDPNLRNSGATSLLIWHMIKFSSNVSKRFDFEGSNIEPIERFFRSFGARRKLYIMLEKHSSRMINTYYRIGRKTKRYLGL